MLSIVMAAITIFAISLIFSIFGKGGGELYIPVMLTFLSISFYKAAGISLFLIFLQSISMVFIYSRKHNLIDWKLAALLAFIVGISSFLGGFFSKLIDAKYLKISFAIVLLISAFFLLLNKKARFKIKGIWHRRIGNEEYYVNIPLILFPVALAAFVAGMVGISGGGLIVPIAVLLGSVPIRFAMGTNTFLVLVSSSMGFLGHVLKGGVDWHLCLIFSIAIIIGSQIGSHMHIKIDEKVLRTGLAIILSLASLWMILHTI